MYNTSQLTCNSLNKQGLPLWTCHIQTASHKLVNPMRCHGSQKNPNLMQNRQNLGECEDKKQKLLKTQPHSVNELIMQQADSDFKTKPLHLKKGSAAICVFERWVSRLTISKKHNLHAVNFKKRDLALTVGVLLLGPHLSSSPWLKVKRSLDDMLTPAPGLLLFLSQYPEFSTSFRQWATIKFAVRYRRHSFVQGQGVPLRKLRCLQKCGAENIFGTTSTFDPPQYSALIGGLLRMRSHRMLEATRWKISLQF